MSCAVCGPGGGFTLFEEVLDRDGRPSEILVCRNCGVLRNTALDELQLSQEETIRFQASAVRHVYAVGAEDKSRVAAAVANTLPIVDEFLQFSEIRIRPSVFLEMGAGAGYLSIAAGKRFGRVFAQDLDPSLIVDAIAATGAKNVTAISTLEEFDRAGVLADCALFWHVLEHVDAPLRFIIDVRERTRQGPIYFQVPLYRREYVFPAHKWFFNARTIEALRDAAGFAGSRVMFDRTNSFMSVLLWQ